MRRSRVGASYANVMATLAVVIAMGGTGYAVSQLPKNSIKAKQIAKNAVRAAEIKTNAVRKAEIKDGEVGSEELAQAAVGSDELSDNSVGSGEVMDDALTGADLNEGSLGRVPDAALLNGLGPDAFLPDSSVRYGQADTGGVPAQTILEFPEFPAALVTDGDIDHDVDFFLRNDRGAGGGNLTVSCMDDEVGISPDSANVAPGASGRILFFKFVTSCFVFDPSGGAPTYFVSCHGPVLAQDPVMIRCFGIRARA